MTRTSKYFEVAEGYKHRVVTELFSKVRKKEIQYVPKKSEVYMTKNNEAFKSRSNENCGIPRNKTSECCK